MNWKITKGHSNKSYKQLNVLTKNRMAMIDKYFSLCGKNSTIGTSAFAPKKEQFRFTKIKELKGINTLPFDLKLVKLSFKEKGGYTVNNELSGIKRIWLDYQPNSMAWPLFSKELKNIIDENLTGNEGVTWISCNVFSEKEK